MADAIGTGIDLASYIKTNGCDCSPRLMELTRIFQSNFNQDVADNAFQGPQLDVDGKYGPKTAEKLAVAIMEPAPDPCWGAGRPCSTAQPSMPPVVVVSPTVTPSAPLPPAPVPTPGSITPVINNVVTPKAETDWTLWIVGGLAVAAGIGAVYYYQKEKKAGKRPFGLEENPLSSNNSINWIKNNEPKLYKWINTIEPYLNIKDTKVSAINDYTTVKLYTNKCRYDLVISPDRKNRKYISGIAYPKKPKPEDHFRAGINLHDGLYNDLTLNKIFSKIVDFEENY